MKTSRYSREETIQMLKIVESRVKVRKSGLYYYVQKYKLFDEYEKIFIEKEKKQKQTKLRELNEAITSCNSITELMECYPQYIYTINKNREQIKQKFTPQKYSSQQTICKFILESVLKQQCLYNTRKILKSKKELDIYFEKYKLACEYNSYFWHQNEKVKSADLAKKEECKNNGIFLLIIEEPELCLLDSYDKSIKEIKKQIISNLKSINKHTNLNITAKQVNSIQINKEDITNFCFNLSKIKEYVTECKTYAEFRQKHNKVYQHLLRTKQLHLLDEFKQKDHRHMSKKTYFKYIKNECKNYTEFLKHKSYSFAYRKGYNQEIKKMLHTDA